MIKPFINIFKINTIRKKMLIYSLMLTFIMLVTSVYTFYNASNFMDRMDYMFTNNEIFRSLSDKIEIMDEDLLNYLSTKNTNSFDSYYKNRDLLSKELNYLSRDISYDKNLLMLKDIANMTDEYLIAADSAINAKRARNITKYNQDYAEANKILGYIEFYINRLNLSQFNENTNKYFQMAATLENLQILNMTIIALTFLINIVLIFWFTRKVSIPIVRLANNAEEISKGNFQVADIYVETHDEVKILADTFNKMKNNIHDYIEEMKSQVEMEAKLKDEKMENLKMKNMLKNAQIRALQSQINPHFLFNTLNAGVQLAMMEDAERTGIFLEKMSSLFRYNLGKMDKPVTLEEELENLRSYVYLLETRFGDMIQFNFDIEEDEFDVEMPIMIIQPIIENACIHGIGDLENGGVINLSVRKYEEFVRVIIEDNGKGIDETTRFNILNGIKNDDQKKSKKKIGHTTGIGLTNVIQRLRVFFDRTDIIEIESRINRGTRIILKLPFNGMQEDAERKEIDDV